jgi:hypothetical protein
MPGIGKQQNILSSCPVDAVVLMSREDNDVEITQTLV